MEQPQCRAAQFRQPMKLAKVLYNRRGGNHRLQAIQLPPATALPTNKEWEESSRHGLYIFRLARGLLQKTKPELVDMFRKAEADGNAGIVANFAEQISSDADRYKKLSELVSAAHTRLLVGDCLKLIGLRMTLMGKRPPESLKLRARHPEFPPRSWTAYVGTEIWHGTPSTPQDGHMRLSMRDAQGGQSQGSLHILKFRLHRRDGGREYRGPASVVPRGRLMLAQRGQARLPGPGTCSAYVRGDDVRQRFVVFTERPASATP